MKQITRTNNGTAVVETLEGRALMSSVTFSDGVLSVVGNTNAYNNLSGKLTSDNQVRASANTTVKYVSATTVKAVKIIGSNGTDNVSGVPPPPPKAHIRWFGGAEMSQAPSAATSTRDQVPCCSLINADTDTVIANFENLGNGLTLSLAKLPTKNLTIVAHVANDTGGSV